jgi:DNA-binding Lrp family transcriptional regulator
MIHTKPDLFEMTAADNERMREIARRQVHGKPETEVQPAPKAMPPVAIEAAMIQQMTGDAKTTGRNEVPKWNKLRQKENRQHVLEQLDTPRTAKEIANTLRKSENSVLNTLKQLADDGLVLRGRKRFNDQGRAIGTLWTLNGDKAAAHKAAQETAIEQRDLTRNLIVDMVNKSAKPVSTTQIATAINRSREYVRDLMKILREEGRVKRIRGHGCYPDTYVSVQQ